MLIWRTYQRGVLSARRRMEAAFGQRLCTQRTARAHEAWPGYIGTACSLGRVLPGTGPAVCSTRACRVDPQPFVFSLSSSCATRSAGSTVQYQLLAAPTGHLRSSVAGAWGRLQGHRAGGAVTGRASAAACLDTTILTPALVVWRFIATAGQPLELVKPEALRFKVFEPIMVIGRQKIKNLDIRLRVKGGGHVSQVYGKQLLTGDARVAL